MVEGMMQSEKAEKTERIKYLTELLNRASKAYYAQDREIMSNLEYDGLYEELEQLAEKLGGALCVTRPIVEKGWYPQDIQVGLSGKQVSPKRYLAIGISGAFQHTVGMSESDYIIAINLDRNAPIFDVADFGIVGDYREIIPHFYHLLAQASVL